MLKRQGDSREYNCRAALYYLVRNVTEYICTIPLFFYIFVQTQMNAS